jgi:hypothetical protein
MNNRPIRIVIFCLAIAGANTAHAQRPDNAKGKLLVAFDFSNAELADEFVVKRGEWTVEDGALSAREIEAEHHAASCHLIQATKDAVFEFRFKSSDDTSKINIGFDPAKGELNKAGHIHAVTISSKSVILSMAGDKKKPKGTTGGKLGCAKVDLKKDTWYQVRVVNKDDECRVSLDGKTLVVGKHPEITVKKPSIIFRAFGERVRVDDIRIWEIK